MDGVVLPWLAISFVSAIVRIVIEHWIVFIMLALISTLAGWRVADWRRRTRKCRQSGHQWDYRKIPSKAVLGYFYNVLECVRCGRRSE